MSHVKIEIDLKEYLHEKAQECRQSEIQACLMFVAGAIFFVGGTLTNSKLSNPSWFLILPYQARFDVGAIVGLSLLISGTFLMSFGAASVMYHYHDRRWFIGELKRAYENELRKERAKEETYAKYNPRQQNNKKRNYQRQQKSTSP